MKTSIYTGTDTLTDNWLLQSVAEFLSGRVDPSSDWGWISSDDDDVYYGQIKAGTFQIDCLITILEQILFANNIYVMKEWIPVWFNQNTDLNKLYSNNNDSIIKELSISDFNIQDTKSKMLENILHTEKLKEKYWEGMELYINGKTSFWSQVINGVADYVSLSSAHNLAYAPHSARAGFLKSNIWFISNQQEYPSPGVRAFNSLVNKERIYLSESRGYDSLLINLNIKIPSGALLCIQKSSSNVSPIEIALQLRNDPEIKSVRTMLHELSMEMTKKSNGEISHEMELLNFLEVDILKASALLKIPKSMGGDDKCGNQLLRQFHFEKYSDNGIIHSGNTIKHSGVLMDLIDTGSIQTRKILETKLHIDNHLIIKQLIDWNDPSFLQKRKNPEIIKQYNIITGDNNIITGPISSVNKLNIEQTKNVTMNETKNVKNNPWISGSFYLILSSIVIAGLAVISNSVHWSLLPLIIIGGGLIIGLVGILQLRNDGKLKDESFVSLFKETFKRLPLLRNINKTTKTNTTIKP